MNPLLVEVDHRPFAWIVGKRRQKLACRRSLKRSKEKDSAPVNAQRQIYERSAHRTNTIEEDDRFLGDGVHASRDSSAGYCFPNNTTPPQICFGLVPFVSGKSAKRRKRS